MKRKMICSCCLFILVAMLLSLAGATAQETDTFESTQVRNEEGTISITIPKTFMDRYEETGWFEELIEDIEARNDGYVAQQLMVSEILEYGMTENGDIIYTVTEVAYQEYEETYLEELQEIVKEQEETHPVKIEYDRELTDICLKIRADDYKKQENNKLLFQLRSVEEIYHALSGTLGIPMSVTVKDPDTNLQLDKIENFDRVQELAQMVEAEKSILEEDE